MLGTRYSKDDEDFRRALRASRKKVGLSQISLAEKLGTTQSTISKMERGELRIDVIDFVYVCKALEVNPGKILEDVFGENP